VICHDSVARGALSVQRYHAAGE